MTERIRLLSFDVSHAARFNAELLAGTCIGEHDNLNFAIRALLISELTSSAFSVTRFSIWGAGPLLSLILVATFLCLTFVL
jgi:hypothetical protein